MRVNSKVVFMLFGAEEEGIILEYDRKTKLAKVECDGYRYPSVQTLKILPKRKKDIPLWYIKK